MAFALLGSVTFRRFHKFISPTQALLGSSFIALNSLGLTVMIIPAKVTYWNLSLYQRLLILCCLFEFAVGVYLPAMSKLQVISMFKILLLITFLLLLNFITVFLLLLLVASPLYLVTQKYIYFFYNFQGMFVQDTVN